MNNLLIFDFDGVVVDTTKLAFKFIQESLYKHGLPTVDDSFLRSIWGRPVEEIHKLIEEEIDEKFPAKLRVELKNYRPKCSPASELAFILQKSRQNGNKIALVTNRSKKDINGILDHNICRHILDLFNFIQSGEKNIKKPDPLVFKSILDSLEYQKWQIENIVFFGDTVAYDYQAVLSFNKTSSYKMLFFGVLSGANTEEDFIKAGLNPDYLISLEEIPDKVSSFLN
jgi:FMN phosphatase YigB (HAD superfamily)